MQHTEQTYQDDAEQQVLIRVLIIEDDSMASKTLERMLVQSRREKYSVATCGTLDEGLKYAGQNPLDAVLLDLALPDSHGTVTVERFAAAQPHLPIVVVTGLEEESDAFLSAEKGAQVCLVKGLLDEGMLRRSIRYAIALKHKEEGDLARSEGRHRAIIENLNDVVFEVAVDGAITYMSPVLERIAGYTQADVTGKPFASFIHPDDLAEISKSFQDVLSGRLHPSEFRIRRKSGSYCWVRTSSRPAIEGGRLVGIHGVLIDITASREAEKARVLEEIGRQWQITFDSLNQVMWLLDAELRIERANQATETILGKTAESVVGRRCWEVFGFDEKMSAACPSVLMKTSRQRETAEFLIGERWLNIVCQPIHGESGALTQAVCSISDITESKRAEEELRALSLRQEAILAAAPDIIAEVDVNKVYTWMNHAGIEFFGDDAVGREAAFYFEGQQDTYSLVQPLFGGDPGIIYVESWQRRRDGQKRLLAWWCRVMKDANGHVVGALSTARDITEQNRAEEALKESQHHLQESLKFRDSILSTSSVGIFTYRASGQCVSANEAAARIAGATVSALLVQNFHELETWKTTGMYKAATKALESGEEQRLETRVVTSFGRDTWLDLAFTRFFSGGEPHLLVIVRDISDKKKTEQALRDSELKFRAIAEQMQDGIFVTDMTGAITYASPNSVRLFGHPPGDMEGRPFTEFLVETEIPKATEAFRRALSIGQTATSLVYSMRRKDGSIFLGELVSSLRKGPGVLGTIVLIRDITERQCTLEALHESEAKYRAVFESTQNMVIVFDAIRGGDGQIVDWRYRDANSAAVKAVGVPREKLIGNTMGALYPERLASMSDAWTQTLEQSKVLTYDLSNDGREYFITMSRMSSESLLGVGVDVTERRRAEASLREFSSKLLSVREEEKSRLSAALHHDVGSMTVGVSARLQAVDEELRARNTGKALKALKECRKLFDTSVKDLKKLAVELRPPDLDVLGLSAALRQHFAGIMRSIPVRIDFTDVSRRAKLSPELQTIFFRIAQESVNNAIAHAGAGRIRVRLAGGRKGTALTVKDNGTGFDPVAVMNRPGSRMGLRAMQEMARSQGGELSVESTPGKGTTVRVEIRPASGARQ